MPQAINLQIPLRNQNDGMFDSNRETLSAIRENIINIIKTRQGERVGRGNIGVSIKTLNEILFNPSNDINTQSFKDKLRRELSEQFNREIVDENGNPKIKIDGFKVYTREENPEIVLSDNIVLVKMLYSLIGTNEQEAIQTELSVDN